MSFEIREATAEDVRAIREIYRQLRRPPRNRIRSAEFYVASAENRIVGCGAAHVFPGGGYLFGLAVRRDYQKRGIGSAIVQAHLDRVERQGGTRMFALVMFWNVGFFRRRGFRLVKREDLPGNLNRLADFRSPVYVHSAVLCKQVNVKERPHAS